MATAADSPDVDAVDAPIGELLELALDGARDLATEEASLVILELEENALALRRAATLALVAGAWFSVAIGWAGVALALALDLGAGGLAVLSLVGAALGAGALLAVRRTPPLTILAKSRVRIEQRIARVTESLR